MTASADGLQQTLSSLSNADVASQICACLRELENANPDLHVRLTKLLHRLSDGTTDKNDGKKTEAPPAIESIDSTVHCTLPGMSLATPRGKYDMVLTHTVLALRNQRYLIPVPYDKIACVYLLDRMKQERANKVFMLLQFEDGFSVPHGKKNLESLTIETKDSSMLEVEFFTTPSGDKKPKVCQGAAAVVLCQVLGLKGVTNFKAPDGQVFSACGRMPCIAGLHKFNRGWLFPLQGVLVFIGTSCFALPHKRILAVDMPGVGGDRKTFDLIFYGHAGEPLIELIQIDTDDLAAWGDYMRKQGLKQVAGTREEGAADPEPSAGGDDDDEDSDDEDFDPSAKADGSDEDDDVGAPGGETVTFGVRGAAGSSGASGGSAAGGSRGRVPVQLPPRKKLRSAAAAGDVEMLELPEGAVEEEMLSEGGTGGDSDEAGSSSSDDA